jgi:hypothetical protein
VFRSPRIRPFVLAAPAAVILVYLSGLDMAVPMLDHWFQLEWYARVADGDFRWWDFFEPHGGIHITAFPRLIQTPLAFATGWSFGVEAALNLAIAGATLGLALRIPGAEFRPSAGPRGTWVPLAMALLVFSPVLWWAWVWTVAFTHLVINLAVVTTAWALAPATAPLSRGRLGIAFAACTIATWTRVEGLLCWWIFLPCLVAALSGSPGLRRSRVLAGWVAVAGIQTLLYGVAVAAASGDAPVREGAFTLAPWTNAVLAANLVGAPAVGFLQAVLPEVADSRRYAPAGVLIGLVWLALAIRGLGSPHREMRDRVLPWVAIGLFGLAFAAAIGVARVGVLESGLLTFAYVSTYAATASWVLIATVPLAALALSDAGAGVGSPWRARLGAAALVLLLVGLAASYAAIVPTALAERSRWRGRELCFELADTLEFQNTCFVKRPPPERLATLARLGFRARPRRDLVFVDAPDPQRGSLERVAPQASRGSVEVEGRVGQVGSGASPVTILLGVAGRHAFFARGAADPGGAFRLSVPGYALPNAAGPAHAWIYERDRARFVRLAGSVALPSRRTRPWSSPSAR